MSVNSACKPSKVTSVRSLVWSHTGADRNNVVSFSASRSGIVFSPASLFRCSRHSSFLPQAPRRSRPYHSPILPSRHICLVLHPSSTHRTGIHGVEVTELSTNKQHTLSARRGSDSASCILIVAIASLPASDTARIRLWFSSSSSAFAYVCACDVCVW